MFGRSYWMMIDIDLRRLSRVRAISDFILEEVGCAAIDLSVAARRARLTATPAYRSPVERHVPGRHHSGPHHQINFV
jgi:hypothetical protein